MAFLLDSFAVHLSWNSPCPLEFYKAAFLWPSIYGSSEIQRPKRHAWDYAHVPSFQRRWDPILAATNISLGPLLMNLRQRNSAAVAFFWGYGSQGQGPYNPPAPSPKCARRLRQLCDAAGKRFDLRGCNTGTSYTTGVPNVCARVLWSSST